MALKLMYITNDEDIAAVAENAGVDRIFVDLEVIGKHERQGNMDTVQSKHSIEDIKKIKNVLKKSELLVRSNPVNDGTDKEIDSIIENGADIVMLPFFKTVSEVERFLNCVQSRAKTCLLFETPEAVENADKILGLSGIDEVFVGLNDLSLGYGKKFMFELLADGTVEKLCLKFRLKGIPFGFGGIAAIGTGTLPAECILKEHYRLGSQSVILSRSFCNYEKIGDLEKIKNIFETGIADIRACETEAECHRKFFYDNLKLEIQRINKIAEEAK